MPYLVIMSAILMVLVLGIWWGILIVRYSPYENALMMMKWEGFFFISSIFILLTFFFYIYYQDTKKSKALQKFFASLTHELKTPLASMKLNAEVLNEFLKTGSYSPDFLDRYATRLLEDSVRLESELDKTLHLSKLEQGQFFKLTPIDLNNIILKEASKFQHLPLEIESEKSYIIRGNETALSIIFKNLFENSLRHHKKLTLITITIQESPKGIDIKYNDHGENFSGDKNKLAQLFYKHQSPKGSGIGLYLIKSLTKKMKGKFVIENRQSLIFCFQFKKA